MDIKVARDNEGYLVDPDEWDEEVATELAREEDITLNEQHWSVLRIMREYYGEHQVAPDIRHVAKSLGNELGCDKKAAKQLMFELFPYGYVKQACKIAGMKRPRAWSTG